MATYYVDVNGAAGSGTESSPYNSLGTAYTLASAGDTIKVKTTAEAPWKPTTNIQDTKGLKWETWINPLIEVDCSGLTGTFALRLENNICELSKARFYSIPAAKFGVRYHANVAKFEDIICEDSAGFGILVTVAWTSTVAWRRVITRRCHTGVNWDDCGASAVMNLEACASYDNLFYDRIDMAATGQLNFYNCLSAGNNTYLYWLEAANLGNVDFYGCVHIAGNKDQSGRDTIYNTSAGNVTYHDSVGTKGIWDSGSFPLGFTDTSTGTITPPAFGNVNPVAQLFETPRREGSACFHRDDLEDYVTGGVAPGEIDSWLDALESRGLRGSFSLSTRQGEDPTTISETGIEEIKQVLARGHQIGTEGRTGAHLHEVIKFRIQYTGTATVCRLVIADNVLTTYEDGVEDLRIPLLAENHPVKLVKNIINADANYTAVDPVEQADPDGGLMNSRTLADIDVADIKAAAYPVEMSEERAWIYELGGCKLDQQNLIGHTPLFHVYSTGSYNASAAEYMRANGWIGGRLGTIKHPETGILPTPFTDDMDLFKSFGVLTGSWLDSTSETTVKRHVDAYCQWAMWHGVAICFYDHAYSTTSLQKWEWIFDAVIASGITIHKGLEEQYQWLKALTAPTTAGDDAWITDAVLSADSQHQGSYKMNRLAEGLNGEPFATAHRDIGANQSSHSPWHMSKL